MEDVKKRTLHFKVYENDPSLMVTYTEDDTKLLHKVLTDEYYEREVIDKITGFYGPEEPDFEGLPYCDYVYEEVDKEVVENGEFDGTTESDDTQEA